MATDEEKNKLAKLLQDMEVPELKLSERCSVIVKEIEEKFSSEVNAEVLEEQVYENPYTVDKKLMEENERNLKKLLLENKRAKKQVPVHVTSETDSKRPWRTQSSKEKLLRIDNDLKRHIEKASQPVVPLTEGDMKQLVDKAKEEALINPPIKSDRLRTTVDEARRNLPNFQYRKIENSTATDILNNAHGDAQDVPTKQSL